MATTETPQSDSPNKDLSLQASPNLDNKTKNPNETRRDLLKAQVDVGNSHNSIESKKLQENLNNKVDKIRESDPNLEKYRKTLESTSIKAIRTNTELLKGDEDPTTYSEDTEMERRLALYSEKQADGGLKINYKQFNRKGANHEKRVGLGDILPSTYRRVAVKTLDGKIHTGTRVNTGLFDKSGEERIGYRDDKTKEYLATHTGDTVYVLDPPLNGRAQIGVKAQEIDLRKRLAETFDVKEQARAMEKKMGHSIGTIDTAMPNEESDVKPDISVTDQIVKTEIKDNENRKRMAEIIESEFIAAELTNKNLIAAAIINAYYESTLNKDIVGDHGKSVGLFQLHVNGAGKGMSIEDRQDPVKNTQGIIKEVKSGRGSYLRERAEAGASVQELTRIFAEKIEGCADEPSNGWGARARKSLPWFNTKEVTPTEEYLVKNYKTSNGQIAESKLESSQETWIIGSSIAIGLGHQNSDSDVGTFGIKGGNAREIGDELENSLIPRIAKMQKIGKMTVPKRVILIGMALNGLKATANPAEAKASADKNIEDYLKIAKTLEKMGITVKISPENIYERKKTSILAFNDTLKKEYPDYYLDTTLDQAPSEELTSDTMHLQKAANNRIFTAEKRLREESKT